jgi:anti-sigma28 factor (negative regulator of flagellin synthesis)
MISSAHHGSPVSSIEKTAPAKLARQMRSVRHQKIKSLKKQISSGKYFVTADDLAKALFLAR